MFNIAECGRGEYMYINGSDSIRNVVERSLEGLVSLVGKNTRLRVRGKNGAIVTRIFNHDNIAEGADMSDLRQTDTKQILVAMDIPGTDVGIKEVLNFSLEFECIDEVEKVVTISGDLSIDITDDDSVVLEAPFMVQVSHTLFGVSEIDTEILKLIENRKYDEAIEKKELAISNLTSLNEMENSVLLEQAIASATKSLESLKRLQNDVSFFNTASNNLFYDTHLNSHQCAYEGFTYVTQ
eukprot:TRINITY_DN1123_c0_g1_i1.p1 TRINITY_DN1123_c0_g1~~TRINITY_DN1123_c0_g1_i1.p1  ORF type:complete len:239 (+),score=60.22 TRINITY_DN1123_c0_g1_i1:705-1421(+)